MTATAPNSPAPRRSTPGAHGPPPPGAGAAEQPTTNALGTGGIPFLVIAAAAPPTGSRISPGGDRGVLTAAAADPATLIFVAIDAGIGAVHAEDGHLPAADPTDAAIEEEMAR